MNCVRCGSENIRKNGIRKDGRQRYKCKDCGREFSGEVPEVTIKEVVCVRCGSKNISKNGKSDEGKQRYICKDCGLVSIMNRDTTTIFNKDKIPKDKKCPVCGSNDIIRAGHSTLGVQKYKCKSCGKRYIDGVSANPLTAEEKKVIIFYHFNFNISICELARHLHRSHTTVGKFVKKYKERKKELCTSTKQ